MNIIVFKIEHNRNDYSRLSKLISQIKKRKYLDTNTNIDSIFIKENYKIFKPDIFIKRFINNGFKRSNLYEVPNSYLENDIDEYVIMVDLSKAKKDVNELQYAFSLFNDDEINFHFVFFYKEEGDYYKFSQFLLPENISTFDETSIVKLVESKDGNYEKEIEYQTKCLYDRIYFVNNKKAVKRSALNTKNITVSSFSKFLPLLSINSSTKSFLYQTVEECYSVWNWTELNKVRANSIIKAIIQCVQNKKNVGEELVRAMSIRFLIESSLINEENCSDAYELYKDMSLLSFFLYSFYMFYQHKEKREIPENEKGKLQYISMIQDICLGIFQLVDNIEKHAKGNKAYISFRIHDNNDFATLKDKYIDYEKVNDLSSYIEILINDINFDNQTNKDEKCIVKNVFLKNLDKPERVSPDGFKEAFHKYAVIKDFFDPESSGKFNIKLWNDYYKIAKNITLHYGLMHFKSILNAYNGTFIVNSSYSHEYNESSFYAMHGNEKADRNQYFIPGTQYSVLIPLYFNVESLNTGIYVPLNNQTESIIKYTEKPMKDYLKQIDTTPTKEDDLLDCFVKNILKVKHSSEKTIHSFDFTLLGRSKSEVCAFMLKEIFIKSLFLYINNLKADEKMHLCIYNCSSIELMQIVGLFCSFYDKKGENASMKNVRVFLVGKDCRDTFLITGKNIQEATRYAERICIENGEFSKLYNVIAQKIWARADEKKDNDRNKKNENDNEGLSSNIRYDLIVKPDGINTVFEKSVMEVLKSDIQRTEMGCAVKDSHIKIGSKIHITDIFFEAETLFAHRRYIEGFCQCIYKKIDTNRKEINNAKDLLLIGYENYSEQLVLYLKSMLENRKPKYKANIHACICENCSNNQLKFRLTDEYENGVSKTKFTEDTKIILIVPINSTLSTQSKIISFISKSNLFKFKNKNVENKIMLNLGVIIVRDSLKSIKDNPKEFKTECDKMSLLENNYWECIDTNKKVISAPKLFESKLKYLITINSQWENPLKCKKCFPKQLTEEKPLIGTNKASVVPTQMIGLKDKISVEGADKRNEKRKIVDLVNLSCIDSSVMKYEHYEYKGNHFQYFFDTDKLLNSIKKDENLNKELDTWIGNLPISQPSDEVYNIIMVPEHALNGSWANYIIDKAFKGNPLVIHYDVMNEYRDNFKARFSNISGLYHNFNNAQRKCLINFYYIDATINTGRTFYRAKSLLRSLFPEEALENKSVNIFESIILLLSRCSDATKKSYISNNMYHAFLEYDIPVMRNHGDSCYLCRLRDEFDLLKNMSATSKFAKVWSNKRKNVSIDEKTEKNETKDDKDIRIRYRLFFNQKISGSINALGPEKNNERIVYETIVKGINSELFQIDVQKHVDKAKQEVETRLTYINKILSEIYGVFLYNPSIIKLRLDYDDVDILNQYNINVVEDDGRKKIVINDVNIDLTDNHIRVINRFFEIVEKAYRSYIISSTNNGNKDIVQLESFIKVISRPFLIDRKSFIDASYRYRLQLLDIILSNEKDVICDEFQLILDLYNEFSDFEKEKILRCLIGSLAKNGANYVMRASVMNSLFSYIGEGCLNLDKIHKEDFLFWYANHIKRLVSLDKDENKALWLEYLLINKKEYGCKKNKLNTIHSNFLEMLYLENTRLIYNGIKDISVNKLEADISKHFKSKYDIDKSYDNNSIPYFLRNFYSVFSLNYNFIDADISTDTNGDNSTNVNIVADEDSEHLERKISSLVKLYNKLNDSTKDVKNDYFAILEEIKNIVNSCRVQLLVKREGRLYYIDESSNCIKSKTQLACDELVSVGINKTQRKVDYSKLLSQVEDNGFDLGVYKNIDNRFIIIKLDVDILDEKRENNTPVLYITMDMNNIIEQNNHFGYLREIRLLLVFYNKFIKKIKQDFGNNLLQEKLKKDSIEKQLVKARSGFHMDTENDFDKSNFLKISQAYFYGPHKLDKKKLLSKYKCNTEDVAFMLMNNTFIGRLNIKLLSEDNNLYEIDSKGDDIYKERLINRFKVIEELTWKKHIEFCDEDYNVLDDNGTIVTYIEKILDDYNVKENSRCYPPNQKYLFAIIVELIFSAIKELIFSLEDEIKILIYTKEECLWVGNRYTNATKEVLKTKFTDGINRNSKGISLATTCEFISKFYEGDNIRIKITDNDVHVGLPILHRKEQ